MIDRSTDIRGALRRRQGGFLLNPYRFGGPAYQDLTTYTEVDTGGALTVTAQRVTYSLPRNLTAYLYKDFGVNYFAANVSIDFDVFLTSSANGALVEHLGLSNQIGDFAARTNALSAVTYRDATNNIFQIIEGDGGTQHSDAANLSLSTPYFMRLARDESIGTYGTAYIYIATSAANRASATWVDTLSITLHSSTKDFRYLYAAAGLNSGLAAGINGYTEKYLINTP